MSSAVFQPEQPRMEIGSLRSAPAGAETGVEPAPAFQPWDPAFQADPYGSVARLREHDPVHRFEPLIAWILTRYDDVVDVLRDPNMSSQNSLATFEKRQPRDVLPPRMRFALDAFFQRGLLFTPRPDHARLRGLVSQSFTPRRVTALRARIQELVDELVDDLSGAGSVDFVAEFANPLPAVVIAELLGVPSADRDRFKAWSEGIVVLLDIVGAPDTVNHARRCADELCEYLRGVIDERRRQPREDLISALVARHADEDALDEMELFGLCMLLLAAGHETTTNLLANGLWLLLEHPDSRRQLERSPDLIPSAVEEMLRFESPVQGMPRVPLEDCELRGRHVSAGDYVISLIGAANRDPAQFPDPDRFDVERRENQHLAFGHGAHYCLGAPLARAEAQIAFETLLRRLPRLEGEYASVGWKPTIVFHGLSALPVRV